MKNFISIVIACVFITSASAQKNWLYISTDYDPESTALKEVIPVVNPSNNHLAVFFKERKTLTANEYDKDHVSIYNDMHEQKLPKKTKVFVGSSVQNNDYVLFFSNESKSKFSRVQVNFKTGSYEIKEDLGLNISKEYFLSYFNQNNKVYILTIESFSSTLKLYTLNFDGAVKTQSFDASDYTFKTSKDKDSNVFKLLTGKPGGKSKNRTIITGEPSSLDIVSAQNKIMLNNNAVTIISDRYNKHTYILKLKIDTNTLSIDRIENESYGDGKERFETNSFVLDDYYFRVFSTSNRLGFFIYDLKTKEKIKSYYVGKNDTITFKNGPIMTVNEIKGSKEIDDTNKFLRRITNADLGVEVHEVNDQYVVTIGASEIVSISTGAMPFMAFGGGAIGGALYASFSSYTTTSSIYIKCLFDKEFNHLEGEIPLNGFDKINEFIIKSGISGMPHQTIFKYKDQYVWGSYSKSAATYGFVIFEE